MKHSLIYRALYVLYNNNSNQWYVSLYELTERERKKQQVRDRGRKNKKKYPNELNEIETGSEQHKNQ